MAVSVGQSISPVLQFRIKGPQTVGRTAMKCGDIQIPSG